MMPSKITFDWTFNVGNLISLTLGILGGIGAWYDVKSDTRINSIEIAALKAADMRFREESKQQRDEGIVADHAQDLKRSEAINDVRTMIRDGNGEIKAEIRDLRNDINRKR